MTAIFNSIMSKLAHSHFYSRTQAISQQREGWFYFVVGSMMVYSLTYTMDLWNWIFNVLPVAAVRTTKWRSQCNDGLKHFFVRPSIFMTNIYTFFNKCRSFLHSLCIIWWRQWFTGVYLSKKCKKQENVWAGNKKKTNEENPLEGRQRHNLH